ncbi:hypothetical protein [Ligilactobacillus sp. LYQ60]|uniref:hypothetical protein n=1 Tax=unclassified Ligilactobacillus TaxID=2767920 RepID=UPI003853C6B1
MRNMNFLKCANFCYLYLPVVLFFIFWLKPFIAIPLVVITLVLFLSLFKIQNNKHFSSPLFWWILLITFILIIYWCASAGLGGFASQSFDWQKHNVLLQDLINKPWPVHYRYNGQNGVLAYYIGFYIIPALAGKLLGFNFAQDTMLIWATIGIALIVINLYYLYGHKRPLRLLTILFGLASFGTFIYLIYGIFRAWAPLDTSTLLSVLGEWFSNGLKVQYTSNTTQLVYVFTQMIPAGLCTVLFIKDHNPSWWGIICAPLILYSTFTFIGIICLAVLTLGYDIVIKLINKQYHGILRLFRDVFSLRNILAATIALGLIAYIGCNITQPKPAVASMMFTTTPWQTHFPAFVAIQVSWLIWFVILLRREKTNPLLYASGIILFVLPFFRFGSANDFCMRVSIPALFVLNYLVIKNIIDGWHSDRFYALILTGMLIFTGMGPWAQLHSPIPNIVTHTRSYNMPFHTGNAFFKASPGGADIRYQYVDWHANRGLAKYIFKK